MNYDLVKYASHGLVAGLGIVVYDVFVDGDHYQNHLL
jgi:hypothetical protein